MIIFLPKYLKAEICRVRNINKSIEKKKIRVQWEDVGADTAGEVEKSRESEDVESLES